MIRNLHLGILVIISILITSACQNRQTGKMQDLTEVQDIYLEKHRPQFHFSPESKWMNDPNGMFYYGGEYHLFYQFYPDSTVWGPMHWGHAKSTDLLHWQHLPIALYPDSLGLIFSGGAVVDNNNTSKLGTTINPPIVAAFTHHDLEGEKTGKKDFQYQSIAYSIDGGTEWIKYGHNPVIPNTEKIKDFRDPKVVWHAKSKKWILALAAYDRVKFYSSTNLIDWKFLSDFGIEGDDRLWECPDLFPIKVEGTNEEKWVLIVSIQKKAPNGGTATSYFIGDFNGQEFKSDIKNQKWLDWGADNYAFVTWNNVPKSDGRTIGLGWMSNWQYAQIVPTENWRSAMTLPRELNLFSSGLDYFLKSRPIKELRELRSDSIYFNQLIDTEEKILDIPFSPSQVEMIIDVDLKETTASSFGIELKNDFGENLLITFDKNEGTLLVDRTNSSNDKFSEEFFNKIHSAPINYDKDTLKIRMFIDASSLEIFINNGELNFTDIFFPTEKFDKISLFAKKGKWNIIHSKMYSLNSIWLGNEEKNQE